MRLLPWSPRSCLREELSNGRPRELTVPFGGTGCIVLFKFVNDNAQEAIAAWIEAELDAGRGIPPAGELGQMQRQRADKGWAWAIAEVDPARFDETIERINITLPRRVLSKLDAAAKAAGEIRSRCIARLAVTR
jgi:HicB_like antitoxin of bacterial toxin-antitoxin system